MATTASRKITVGFTGDVIAQHVIPAAGNSTSPAVIELVNLASGANTITVPTGGAVSKSVVIVPPAANTTSITFKGVTGDTGVRLHDTDPTNVALHSSVTSFCLTAGAGITGVRIYWT